jgi:hypothetical protein
MGACIGLHPLPSCFQRARCIDFIHQTVPLSSCDSVAQSRQHGFRPDATFHPCPAGRACTLLDDLGFCPPFSHCRHSRGGVSWLHLHFVRLSSCLPSLGMALLSTLSAQPWAFARRRHPSGTMKALTAASLRLLGSSLRLSRITFLSFRPQPLDAPVSRFCRYQ